MRTRSFGARSAAAIAAVMAKGMRARLLNTSAIILIWTCCVLRVRELSPARAFIRGAGTMAAAEHLVVVTLRGSRNVVPAAATQAFAARSSWR